MDKKTFIIFAHQHNIMLSTLFSVVTKYTLKVDILPVQLANDLNPIVRTENP